MATMSTTTESTLSQSQESEKTNRLPLSRNKTVHQQLPLEDTGEDEEETQEATPSLAAAKYISMVATVLTAFITTE